jgi:IS5 family transposase
VANVARPNPERTNEMTSNDIGSEEYWARVAAVRELWAMVARMDAHIARLEELARTGQDAQAEVRAFHADPANRISRAQWDQMITWAAEDDQVIREAARSGQPIVSVTIPPAD